MFRDKKFTIPFIAELVMPWLIVSPGMLAFQYFNESSDAYNSGNPAPNYYSAENLFNLYYAIAMGGGLLILLIECSIGLVAFIQIIINISKKNKEPFCIIKPLILWLCPFAFNIGTLILMFFILAFTYGQGV